MPRRREIREAEQQLLPPHPEYPGEPLGAIWMMPDDDLRNAIDSMASTSQALKVPSATTWRSGIDGLNDD